jgi:hypothetical protein
VTPTKRLPADMTPVLGNEPEESLMTKVEG